jgi:hypothetical protein
MLGARSVNARAFWRAGFAGTTWRFRCFPVDLCARTDLGSRVSRRARVRPVDPFLVHPSVEERGMQRVVTGLV